LMCLQSAQTIIRTGMEILRWATRRRKIGNNSRGLQYDQRRLILDFQK
jgi:hypothetical protein